MKKAKSYLDLKGRAFFLQDLDQDEENLVATLADYSKDDPDWNAFSNFWMTKVGEFYAARGLTRQAIQRTIVYRIAQDLGSRLAIAAGTARAPDYRDDLEELIRTRFGTRRKFCEATGMAEDMLSHVLAKRKHFAVDTLVEALQRIGYTVHIAPMK